MRYGHPNKLVRRYPYERITPEQWSMIKLYYRMGYSVRMIARCYGYHESNIIAKAKKEGWVFNDLGIFIHKMVDLILNIQSFLQQNVAPSCWYCILRDFNAHAIANCNFVILFYSIGKDIKVDLFGQGYIPKKFMPTAKEIARAKKDAGNKKCA